MKLNCPFFTLWGAAPGFHFVVVIIAVVVIISELGITAIEALLM